MPASLKHSGSGECQDRQIGSKDESLSATISNRIAALYREHYGRGPDRVKAYIHEDSVVCVSRGGGTRLEHTLVNGGADDTLRALRSAFQEAVEGPVNAEIEKVTGRRVEAHFGDRRSNPDISIEVFVLESEAS